jgi:hypothetical protein
MKNNSVIVWDLETIPDLEAFARMSDKVGLSVEQLEAELGDKFPRLPLQR